ncbi:MAG: STAS domain-containing protein [Spirochaetes bacterium]|nr:STAS domain-containing protein [Spirochaetota bacterium]MBN2771147.1 STAS domain-containing protein [Spirochaetota bacterium]
MPFQYDLTTKNDVSIITLMGELRIFDLADYTSFFEEQIANGKVKIIINFEKITYIDSTAIGLLVNIKRNIEEKGGRLTLISVKPDVMNVLQITGINQFLDIYDSLETAMASY